MMVGRYADTFGRVFEWVRNAIVRGVRYAR